MTLLRPYGDDAVRFEIPARASRRELQAALRAAPGVDDVILAEAVGCAVLSGDPADGDRIATLRALTAALAGAAPVEDAPPPREHLIEVVYDGEDLDAVGAASGLGREGVMRVHGEATYEVAMLGFLPGFGYLRELPEPLRLPRRAPRPRVPRGSVAIAASYTAVYPCASPGGWNLLGRAPHFDPLGGRGTEGARLALGDRVRFAPIAAANAPDPTRPAGPGLPPPVGAHLEVTRAAGFAFPVDGGRPGRMHEGIPPGGPLVRSALARANARAGNSPGACALEITGTIEVTARGGRIRIGDHRSARDLAEGERHVVSTEGRARVRYLALAGGIDAPVVLGGRGVLLAAGIGGLLRRGDRLVPGGGLPAARARRDLADEEGEPADPAPIRLCPGPDAVPELSLAAIADATYRVSSVSDRTGTRLDGPLPVTPPGAMSRPSAPMVLGAIELTPSGLVVFGPDHPTTGGYPVVAVVRRRSLDAFFARPAGSTVRFVVDEPGG